ncbi:MAG TPA: molecular chaperone TorD family protein [Bryobacteraceae bacterium]|nr:molecular chaperone TorD family protein [Bryobacteraceae bacterium]
MAIYSLFADILDYPAQPIAKAVNGCAAELEREFPEAHAHMADFQDAVVGRSLGQLQEIYINAFDLRPDCTPNLGYHLFGDDGRRGLFLAELKGRMETSGIALGSELPDHISLLLRYMCVVEQERGALTEDCMLPAISRMAEVLASTENPYKHALHALLSLLQYQHDVSGAPAETMEA